MEVIGEMMAKQIPRADRLSKLEAYVRECAALMNLGAWKVSVMSDVAPEDRYADIEVHSQAATVTMRIGNLFWTQKPEDQRLTVCHELTHIHLAMSDHAVAALEDVLGSAAWTPWHSVYEDHQERGTDAIAELIAPLLPVPNI